jgi:hypothetical protein
MKKNIKYIKRIGIFVLALLVVSCTEFKEFKSETYGPGPTITLAQVSVQDSTFTVSVTSSADGHASIILLPGSDNAVPDPEDLVTGNVEAMDYQSKAAGANNVVEFTFVGLVQDAMFEVMAAANNGDGKVSDVATLGVGTDDTHAPVLVETVPEVSYDPVLTRDGTVVLVFDEAVMYDDTKDLTFSKFYDGVDMLAGTVEVDFNVVTITPADSIRYREYLWLSYPEGAFTDYSGNLAAEVVTYLDADAGAFVGLYWRAEAGLFEAVSVSPEEGIITPSAFDIVVTFAEAVDAADVATGDITITYDNGLSKLTNAVLASEVSSDGNDLVITQSRTPLPGETVTVDIPEGVFEVGIGNPNAEFSAFWDISHPLQTWLGDYTVAAISYADPGNWDEAWTVTIASYAADLSMLAITIDAGSGGGTPFLASFDDVAMTVSIPAGSVAGNLYTYGPTGIYYGDYATLDETAAVVGTIANDGTILIDNLTMILTDYGFVDGLWDAFNTAWTPAAAKKAATRGDGLASKAARFK